MIVERVEDRRILRKSKKKIMLYHLIAMSMLGSNRITDATSVVF